MAAAKGNQYAKGCTNSGRPTIIDANDMCEKLSVYIKENEEPMIIDFCVQYGISKQRFYELVQNNQELADLQKELITKEESFLVRNGERGHINPVFTMFRLKQPAFGYKDKTEIETSGETTVTNKIDLSGMSTEDLKEMLK